MGKTDFSFVVPSLLEWMVQNEMDKGLAFHRKFIRFIEGEANMSFVIKARNRAFDRLNQTGIPARPLTIEGFEGVRPDQQANGFWVPVMVFVHEDEIKDAAPPNTDENREKLAITIAERMELDTIIEFAANKLIEEYENNSELFEEDWGAEFGEDNT